MGVSFRFGIGDKLNNAVQLGVDGRLGVDEKLGVAVRLGVADTLEVESTLLGVGFTIISDWRTPNKGWKSLE